MTTRPSASRLEDQKDIVSDLAHDLRNPLTAILGYLELLEHADDDEARAHAVTRIRQAALRIETMLDATDTHSSAN